MRILYCTDTYLPQINGVSIVTALSVRGLRERGWTVRVVGPRYPIDAASGGPVRTHDADELYRGIASLPIPFYPELRVALPTASVVAREIRDFRPDVVHCATEFVIGRQGMRAATRAGIPVVTSYHTNFGQYAAAYGLSSITRLVERYIRTFHTRAVATLTPSDVSRRHLESLGIAHAQRWGCGVDVHRFVPENRSLARRATLGVGSAFTLLYVGRLAAEKQVDTVIRAYAAARTVLPRGAVRLVIAGTGPRESALRAIAPDDTIFLGHLDRERDLPTLYASADAFCFASTTETLGLVILEALASGLPVIATPAGGVAEHLVDEVNGIAVPAADPQRMAAAIVRLVREPDTRRRLSVGARESALALGWHAELDRLDATYRRTLQGGPVALPR